MIVSSTRSGKYPYASISVRRSSAVRAQPHGRHPATTSRPTLSPPRPESRSLHSTRGRSGRAGRIGRCASRSGCASAPARSRPGGAMKARAPSTATVQRRDTRAQGDRRAAEVVGELGEPVQQVLHRRRPRTPGELCRPNSSGAARSPRTMPRRPPWSAAAPGRRRRRATHWPARPDPSERSVRRPRPPGADETSATPGGAIFWTTGPPPQVRVTDQAETRHQV